VDAGAIERHGASLVVVGTQGEHPLAGAILGSVPHKLLHVSPVPVLVVPGGRE
jgi:nucleotide-binding universal stress UspA family protein